MHNYDRSDDFDPARGIAFGLALSAPFWLAVALICLGLRSVAL